MTHDYRLHYVWAYSDNLLELKYLVSSFWGGQEGSFLLWIFWGVLLGLPLMRFARAYESRVMVFYNLTLLSLIMLLLKQDPFRFHEGLTTGMIPLDGQGLNPLLQNPWMVIHPPIMFIGYASLAIPFAFALAALWMRRYDEWTKASMPWVLLSLGTLGTAIMLGGYWAYETLGWGGYWGWDPVENASLVPWLATAALTHGMLLQRSRHRFRRLNRQCSSVLWPRFACCNLFCRISFRGSFDRLSRVDCFSSVACVACVNRLARQRGRDVDCLACSPCFCRISGKCRRVALPGLVRRFSRGTNRHRKNRIDRKRDNSAKWQRDYKQRFAI